MAGLGYPYLDKNAALMALGARMMQAGQRSFDPDRQGMGTALVGAMQDWQQIQSASMASQVAQRQQEEYERKMKMLEQREKREQEKHERQQKREMERQKLLSSVMSKGGGLGAGGQGLGNPDAMRQMAYQLMSSGETELGLDILKSIPSAPKPTYMQEGGQTYAVQGAQAQPVMRPIKPHEEDMVAEWYGSQQPAGEQYMPAGEQYIPSQAPFRGAPKPQKLTERQRRAQQLMRPPYNLSEREAYDMAYKDVVIQPPDQFGNVYAVDRTAGTKRLIREATPQGRQPSPSMQLMPPAAPTTAPTMPPTPPLEQAVQKGIGPIAMGRAAIANIIGPFIDGALMKDTTDARQAIRITRQLGKMAFINNPKAPVHEQKLVDRLFPDERAFFKDQDTARSDLQVLRMSLKSWNEARIKELKYGRITEKRRGELSDQISATNQFLSFLGEIPRPKNREEVEALSPGSIFYPPGKKETWIKN